MSDLPTGAFRGARAVLLLVLFGALVLLPGIVSLPALDRDESRYMQASRQMLESGDFVRIRYQDTARNKKPAGIYWLQAASVAVFSEPEATARWPYRIPSFLGALAAVLLTFWVGRILFDRKTGLLAAGMLGGSLLLVIDQHFAKTDAALLATVVAAQGALARAYMAGKRGEDAGWLNAAILWIAIGIGFLIKGPITPVVAGLTWLGLRFFDRETRIAKRLRPLPGVLLAVLIAAPWFIAIILLTEGEFLQESAGRDFFGKLISGQERHGAPPGYYLVLMTATFAPASLFVWPALGWAWGRRKADPAILFCLVWLVPFWLIVELVPTKLPHYVLPVYPALALLTARAVFAAEAGDVPRATHWSAKIAYVAWAFLVLGFAGAIFALPVALGEGVDWIAVLPVAVSAAVVAYALPKVWRGRPLKAAIVSLLAAPLVYAPLFAGVLPDTETIWPSRSVARAIERLEPQPTAIASTGIREPSLVFYLGTDTRLASPQSVADLLASKPGALAIVDRRQQEEFLEAAEAAGLRLEKAGTVEGFNYSNGKWLRLTLYRAGRE